MKRRKGTVLMIVVGAVVFLGVVTISLGAWFFASVFESTSADERAAAEAFNDIRGRFSGVSPVFFIVDGEDAVVRRQPPDVPAAPLRTLEIRHWDPDDEGITSVSLPFWVLRLKTGTFSVGGRRHPGQLSISSDQIERYGPTLLVDHQGRGGDRLLVWTE
jgi:hypothetical protein